MHTLRTIVSLSIMYLAIAQAGIAQSLPSQATSASPELVGQLTKGLGISPTQAMGGAGTLFGLAKSRLSSADFSKIAGVVPGMDKLLKAAPSTADTSGLSGLTGSLPGGMGSMVSSAEAFQKLGLSPDMAGKFVPILTNFVQSKGGANVASLLSGALK